MTARRFILGSLLLFHVAISLLGNVGLHSVLGCHHQSAATACCSAPRTEAKSQPHRCGHGHGHCHSVPAAEEGSGQKSSGQENPSSHLPVTDDDCAICQFFARPAEVAVPVQWTPRVEVVAVELLEFTAQPGLLLEAAYDARGPPAAA